MSEAKRRLIPIMLMSLGVGASYGAPISVNAEESLEVIKPDPRPKPSLQSTLNVALEQQGIFCMNRRYQRNNKSERGALRLYLFDRDFNMASNTEIPIQGHVQPDFNSQRMNLDDSYEQIIQDRTRTTGESKINKFVIEIKRGRGVIERWLGRLYSVTDEMLLATFQPLRIGNEVYAYPDPDFPAGYPVHLSNRCQTLP